jgi:penicillin-binding protein 2
MSVGIGQGELQLTTLQMANLAACIANRGYWYRPHIAKMFKDKTPIPARFLEIQRVPVDPKNFDIVIEGMAQCVNRGTARIAALPDIQVCGKTGTSQNPHGEDHSVFFAFAPKDNPQIAIAVYVENAGWGASYAAPIASLMIEKYLKGRIAPERLPLEERMIQANLIDKVLANRPKIAGRPNQPPVRDSLPNPIEVPSDVPETPGGGETTRSTANRRNR